MVVGVVVVVVEGGGVVEVEKTMVLFRVAEVVEVLGEKGLVKK